MEVVEFKDDLGWYGADFDQSQQNTEYWRKEIKRTKRKDVRITKR